MDNKYNYILNTTDAPYIQYWFAKKLSDIASSSVIGEGTDFDITSPSERTLKEVVLKGDTTQETLSGKNLIPVSEYTGETRETTFRIDLPINTYTISFNLDSYDLGTNESFGLYLQLYYNDNSSIDKRIITITNSTQLGRYSYTLTTEKPVSAGATVASNIRIPNTMYTNGGRAVLSDIQLELGSTPTPYEPYCGGIPSPNPDYPQTVNTVTGDQTITITKGSDVQTYSLSLGDLELCKIGDYQDHIYKSGDKWYVKKNTGKYQFTGNETFNYNSNGGFIITNANSPFTDIINPPMQGFSDKFRIESTTTTWTEQGKIGLSATSTFWCKWSAMGTNATEIGAWLSTNQPIVYYAIKTPTDTEITDETLLGQLNTILSDGYLSAGTNTVQTSATGLPIIINIKA